MPTSLPKPSEVTQLIRDAIAAARAGDKGRANTLFRHITKIQPENEAAWLWFANTAALPGDAVTGLRAALRLNPANEAAAAALPVALLRAGIAAAKSNDRPAAAAYLADVTRAEPNNATAWLWRAGVTDDPADAIAHLEQVLRLDPNSAQAKQGIAKLKEQLPPAWRCPVCEHTPRDGDTVSDVCMRCRSIVDLFTPEVFDTAVPGINRALVEAAAQRLRAKWATAPTPETAFGLGLAYLNLGFGDEGVRALRTAAGGRSANPAWRDEIARLIQHREELARAQQGQVAGDTKPNLPALAAARASSRPRVMVVDDSPTVRRMVSIALKNAGYEVTEAVDADHAAKLVHETGAPRLFILDVNMPGMDGFGLCKHLRADAETAKVPIVFLTGKTGLLNKIHGRWAGAAEYLTKPFQPEKLLATVSRLVPVS